VGAVLLRPATRPDLLLRERWMADPATMAYTARAGADPADGCLAFPVEVHEAWLRHWQQHPDERFHAVLEHEGTVVGEVAFRVEDGEALLHLLVVAGARGSGLGAVALAALVARAWAHPGVRRLVDELPADREPAATLFRRAGFERVGERVVQHRPPDGIRLHTTRAR
jgi:RimJ/RimL family protein N-acetyltransferase